MNAMLLDLLAARAATAGNPAFSDLLARLRASVSGDDPQAIDELLAQLGQGNPAVAAMLSRFKEQRAAVAARTSLTANHPEENSDTAGAAPQFDEAAEAVSELRRQIQGMYEELSALRNRNDLLASAIGACCLCWGQNPECRICRGRGRPGFSIPDEALFEQFVLPAVLMLRAQKTKGSNSAVFIQSTTSTKQAPG